MTESYIDLTLSDDADEALDLTPDSSPIPPARNRLLAQRMIRPSVAGRTNSYKINSSNIPRSVSRVRASFVPIDLTEDGSEDDAKAQPEAKQADPRAAWTKNDLCADSPKRRQNIKPAPPETTAVIGDTSPIGEWLEATTRSPNMAASNAEAPSESRPPEFRQSRPGNPYNKQTPMTSSDETPLRQKPVTRPEIISLGERMRLHGGASHSGVKQSSKQDAPSPQPPHIIISSDDDDLEILDVAPLPPRTRKLASRTKTESIREDTSGSTRENINKTASGSDTAASSLSRPPLLSSTSTAQAGSDLPEGGLSGDSVMDNPKLSQDQLGLFTIPELKTILRKHVRELYDDHEYFTKNRLMRARRSCRAAQNQKIPAQNQEISAQNFISGPSIVPEKFRQDAFPWPNAKPIQKHGPPKPGESKHVVQRQQEVMAGGIKPIKSLLHNPFDRYACDAIEVPPYTSYVSLKQNILAENQKTLLYEPYFDDEQASDARKNSLWDELHQRFNKVTEERPRRIEQAEKSWQYRSYAEAFLTDIGCDMKDVLSYLLTPEVELKKMLNLAIPDSGVEELLEHRKGSCEEDFNRDKRKWKTVMASLPETTPQKLCIAGRACVAWQQMCNFTLWHIARRSSFAQLQKPVTQNIKAGDATPFSYRQLACRVCHLHNCPFHGEIREGPGSSEHSDGGEHKSDSSDDEGHSTDSNSSNGSSRSRQPSITSHVSHSSTDTLINIKKHVNAPPRNHPDDDVVPAARRSVHFWLAKSKTHLMDKRPPFFPCSHDGSCDTAPDCTCRKYNVTCEKTCACPASCKRRFRGCTCAQQGKVCWENKKCDCYALNRECDPDLCATCGAAEVLDPANRYNAAMARGKCGNVCIQRNVPKRTLLGLSEVQGFGLFMGEKVKAGDYLGEYKGEILTKGEGSRRGAIYQHLLTNYLFDLNKHQEVDSTKAGNKFRFINNSALEPNCAPKLLFCNTVVRIGMFALVDIDVGEELFFNYNYPKEITKHFWEKGERTKAGGTAVAVKTKKGKHKYNTTLATSTNTSFSSDPSSTEVRTKRKYVKSGRYARLKDVADTGVGSSIFTSLTSEKGKRPKRNVAMARTLSFEETDETMADEGDEEEDEEEDEEYEIEVEETEADEWEIPTDEDEDRPKKRGRKKKLHS